MMTILFSVCMTVVLVVGVVKIIFSLARFVIWVMPDKIKHQAGVFIDKIITFMVGDK